MGTGSGTGSVGVVPGEVVGSAEVVVGRGMPGSVNGGAGTVSVGTGAGVVVVSVGELVGRIGFVTSWPVVGGGVTGIGATVTAGGAGADGAGVPGRAGAGTGAAIPADGGGGPAAISRTTKPSDQTQEIAASSAAV